MCQGVCVWVDVCVCWHAFMGRQKKNVIQRKNDVIHLNSFYILGGNMNAVT